MAHENDWVVDKIQEEPAWVPKTWSGLTSFPGLEIWTDGTNVYCSSGAKQYVLNRKTSTWESKDWGSKRSTYGQAVWTDGNSIYYSSGYNQYILDKSTYTWSDKTWSGLTSFNGRYTWTDGDNIYYSWNDDHYVLDKTTSTWVSKTWSGLTSFDGDKIWTDGTNVYYSSGANHYVLDKSTSTWTTKTWSGLTSFSGYYIWTDGTNVYYSSGANHYVLDKATSTWVSKTWSGLTSIDGEDIWFDGDHIYYSRGSSQYYLRKPTSVPYRLNFPELKESINIHDKWVADVIDEQPETWIQKEWDGVIALYGSDIWHDGNNTYYSHGTSGQYVLDTITDTWVEKTWTGFKNVYAKYVWTDGTDIYCSLNSTRQYVLDRSTSTWVAKTWGGTNIGSGEYAWTDGENTYYSYEEQQLVLNKQQSTWENKTWNGLTSFDGSYVWTDGTDIYYSYDNDQYVLDKSTSTWTQMAWNGLNSFRGKYIWFDSGNIYYSYATNSQHYQLDKSTNTWISKTWDGMRNLNGANIWHYKNKTYYSYNTANMELRNAIKITSTPYRMEFPEMIESIDINSWLIDDDIPFRRNFPPLIKSIDPDSWLIDDDIPFRLDFPPLIPSEVPSDSWLQDKGWDPRRPWPEHRSIIQKVQTIPNIPDVDWTKSMQQTFEFYTVDPNNWYDDQKLENIISCDLTHDLTSDKRGNASISVTEPLPECYIRTYLVVTQAGYMHKICLGTYLYMTSADSFDGMKHNITMTGYTPMVELEEKLPPLGFHVIGITNRKHSGDAPMVTDAIKDIVTTYTRCEIENRTVIQKPLLNDFVAGTNDNFLTVINNILNASSLQQYILTVDEWGTIIVKDKPVLEDAIPTYIYTDDNSSILLPSIDTNDDIYGIPNVVEVLYTGDKRLPAIRVIVKNEDPTSIVSIPARGREIVKRFTINNIAAPVNDYSEAAVRAQVTAQAEKLLEAASTINKTISYSHGYCDVKVGDTVLINYERAGVTGIRAKVVSQRISCKPGCQVDEQAVYTKKLWNRGV